MATRAQSLAPPDSSHRRVPDFFIVGSPKTGTTSLYHMLTDNPRIYMPTLKEPHFLASDMHPRPKFAEEQREATYPLTLEDYLALFDPATADQRVGEASTFYLWSHTAAATIADLQPNARIIAILREPASFLRSMHNMLLGWDIEAETDLRKALSLEAARREGRNVPSRSHRPQLLLYSEHVRYVDQLGRYEARFPAEQILVLIYEDFRHDNEATVRKVLQFLDADDCLPISEVRANVTTERIRSPRARHLLYSISEGRSPAARSTKATLKALLPRQFRRRAARTIHENVVRGEARPVDEALMLELRRRYKPEVLALSEHLDRDLVSLWGYQEID